MTLREKLCGHLFCFCMVTGTVWCGYLYSVVICRVREFEYTRECIVFDLLSIHLYHGWLADPQNDAEITAVGQCTYNQLVEKIIEDKHSQSEQKLTEGSTSSVACSRA